MNQLTDGCVMPREWVAITQKNTRILYRSKRIWCVRGIADDFGLMVRSRKRSLVYQRHYLSWWAFEKMGMGWSDIAEALDKNHATIFHSHGVVEVLLETKDKEFNRTTKDIREYLSDYK